MSKSLRFGGYFGTDSDEEFLVEVWVHVGKFYSYSTKDLMIG